VNVTYNSRSLKLLNKSSRKFVTIDLFVVKEKLIKFRNPDLGIFERFLEVAIYGIFPTILLIISREGDRIFLKILSQMYP